MRGEPSGDGVASSGLVVDAEVDGAGVLQEQEVPERAGAVVTVDAVGIAGMVFVAGRFVERPFDHAGPAGAVDAAKPQHHGRNGTAEDEALPLEEAKAARAYRSGWGVFVHPLAVLLAVDAGAGDEDEAPKSVPGRQSREEVRRAIYIDGLVGLVGGASGGGCVDDSVEVFGQDVGRHGCGEIRVYRMDPAWEGGGSMSRKLWVWFSYCFEGVHREIALERPLLAAPQGYLRR